MSRYANDPRVQAREGLFGTAYNVDVNTPNGDGHVYREKGKWMACVDDVDEVRGPFPSADDAIESLIGKPQTGAR